MIHLACFVIPLEFVAICHFRHLNISAALVSSQEDLGFVGLLLSCLEVLFCLHHIEKISPEFGIC